MEAWRLITQHPSDFTASAGDQYEICGLTRIFHTDSAAACEHLMDTASVSNCSSGSMKHTAVVAIHHLPCLHQDSRRLATNQYEICGLSRERNQIKILGQGSFALKKHMSAWMDKFYLPGMKEMTDLRFPFSINKVTYDGVS